MQDFQMKLVLNAPASKVYEAIASKEGARNWWTRFAEISEKVGGISKFRFPQADFFANMKITKMEPNQLVEWECVDARHPQNSGWSDLRDWVGAKIRFEIDEAGPYSSRLNFTRLGLVPQLECYKTCESAWAYYLNESLRDLLEKGKGKPYDDDSENKI